MNFLTAENNIFSPRKIPGLYITDFSLIEKINYFWLLKHQDSNTSGFVFNHNLKSVLERLDKDKIKELAEIIYPNFLFKFDIDLSDRLNIQKCIQSKSYITPPLHEEYINQEASEIFNLVSLLLLINRNDDDFVEKIVAQVNYDYDLLQMFVANPIAILGLREITRTVVITVKERSTLISNNFYKLILRYLNSEIEEDIIRLYNLNVVD